MIYVKTFIAIKLMIFLRAGEALPVRFFLKIRRNRAGDLPAERRLRLHLGVCFVIMLSKYLYLPGNPEVGAAEQGVGKGAIWPKF